MIHKDSSISLSPLTVFVGPNNAGKSALFDGLLNFSMLSRGNISQAFGPYPYSFRTTLHHGVHKSSRISYEIELAESQSSNEYLQYIIDYSQTETGDVPKYTIHQEKLTALPSGEILFDRANLDLSGLPRHISLDADRSFFSVLRAISTPELDSKFELAARLAPLLSRFNKFRLDPTTMAQPSRLPDPSPEPAFHLGYHGEDLPSILYSLQETDIGTFSRVIEQVKAIDQEFSGIVFNSVGTDRIGFSADFRDSRGTIPAVRLSSGLLTYLGLIVLVTAPNRPPLMMIEEPENGLPPNSLTAFYHAVRDLAFREGSKSPTQVLMSSHSPFVICDAWNNEDRDFIIQVTVKEGSAVIRPFKTVIEENNIHLGKMDGERRHLSLNLARQVMSGDYSSP